MVSSVVFVTWDGGGNVPPMIAVAREVQRQGAAVRILGHPRQRAQIEAAGLAFESFAHAREWSSLTPRSGLRADLGYAAVFADRGIGRDVLISVQRAPADRIVVDGLLIGCLAELAEADVPYSIFVHTLRSVMVPAVRRGPLGLILRTAGFRPGLLYERAESEVVVAEPSFDPGAGDTAPRVHHVGAVLPVAAAAHPDPRTPVVLVSLSTTHVAGQRELLQRILDALAALDVHTVVTTGPSIDRRQLRPAANSTIHQALAHPDVMATASFVIGHGGHGTTMLALAHGLPLVVIPTNPSFDQPRIAELVVDRGLGLRLSKRASVGDIRVAASDLLSDPHYADAAGRLGSTMRARDAAADAAEILLAR
ncbi:hypothetical protein N1027_08300 [Herbiconiux sp. CPCC 205763]|uniref:Erythromycin biosynthesis protein CIII-like C-terminal domain-containing protein n=1 Tax=Herbiconiux aconitum TaxID=2970913 RepID=A0ABT2GPI0_9MICO|nr:nucleotide disphospho-sugar-binding domain-containing protein [Herbiconiux aconitum]MCS5718136.1 hypothetical protein [Herbiconiux aconitum]